LLVAKIIVGLQALKNTKLKSLEKNKNLPDIIFIDPVVARHYKGKNISGGRRF
jgi:hypothetical protein